jgi:VWFA-related protein
MERVSDARRRSSAAEKAIRLARSVVVVSVLAAAAVTVLGQQLADPQSQTPTFRGGVDAVQIDAFVTDANGRPVRGLTVDDFEVYRDEQSQPITTFATVDIPVVKSAAPAFADEPDVAVNTRPEGRIYMFMLGGMSADMALRTRHLLHRFMDQYFGDNDMAAVVGDRGLVTDGQDFTYSRRLILQAIDKFGGGSGGGGAAGSVLQRSDADYARSAQGLLDRGTSADLRGRMEFFTRIPGHRKFVLWFTDSIGFDAFDVVDYHGGVPSMGGEQVHAAVAAATRGNIRIYPISPMGLNSALGPGELERRMDFRAIAEVTGGTAHVGSNEFDEAFANLIEETSTYYVLGVEAAPNVKQGRYVRFNVRVKRPGLTVKARPGYAEQLEYIKRRTRPEPTRTPVAAALANPILVPGVPMRVVATPFKGDGRNAAVALTVDLEASTLSFAQKDGKAVADLQLRHLATGARKDIYPEWRYAGEVVMSVADRERVRGRGLRVVSQLDLPKGRYQIRVASASGGNSGSVVYDLDIPDFSDGDLTMSGVMVTTATSDRTVTLKGESDKASVTKGKCAPPVCSADVSSGVFVSQWADATKSAMLQMLQKLPTPPTTDRTVTAGDTLGVFVEVYDNNKRVARDPAYQISVNASLLDAAGRTVRQVSDSRSSQAARRASGGHGFSMMLPLTEVAAGDYVIQVESRSERNPEHVETRRIPVRVEASGSPAARGTS